MAIRPPKIVIPGLNRGAGVPPGYVLGRRRGAGQGPAELLDINQLQGIGIATRSYAAQGNSTTASTAASATASLSSSTSAQISSVVSTNVGQSTSLSQISSSLSGAISSTVSLSTAVSTVISGSVSAVNSRIDSLSAAIGGGGTIAVQDEGTPVGVFTTLNFAGAGVDATDAGGGVALVTIPGGGGGGGTSTSLSQISSSLSSEISSRISGDSSLSTVISSEVSSRASGDTSLSTVVSGSTSTLNSRIDSLSTAIGGGGAFSGALAHKAADETAANYASGKAVSWDSEASGYDTDSYHGLASTVTITIASPGVITWTGHNFAADAPIVLTTTGALPTGLTAGTIYYVVSPAANTFQLATAPGGAAINTSGTQSGTHTGTNYSRMTVPATGKYQFAFGFSVSSLASGDYVRGILSKNGSLGLPFAGSCQQTVEISATPAIQFATMSAIIDCTAGDYFEVWLDTESDASITVQALGSWFSAHRIS